MRIHSTILFLSASLAVSGCATSLKTQLFPSAWPQNLQRPTAELSKPLSSGQPTVAVRPLVVESGSYPRGAQASGEATADVLTDLLVRQLRAHGVKAVRVGSQTSNADYLLVGMVPRLHYSIQGGYPKKTFYSAELACRLVDQKNGSVMFERSAGYVFEHTALVNTMTRLPAEPNEHEEVLIQRGVEPIWEAVASAVAISTGDAPAIDTVPPGSPQ